MRKKPFPKQDEIDFDTIDPEVVEEAKEETPVVFSYSRAEALADGTLRDAGQLARDAGFGFPVALTSAAWEKVVTVPTYALGESEGGRLWDVLNVLKWVVQDSDADDVDFLVCVTSHSGGSEEVPLRAVCGPGDDGEPVITVMLEGED